MSPGAPASARYVLVVLLVPLIVLTWGLLAGAPGSRTSGPEEKRTSFLVEPYVQLPTLHGMTVMWETAHKSPSRVEYGQTPGLGRSAGTDRATQLHEVRLDDLEAATTYYYRVRSGGLTSDVYHFRTAPPPGTTRWKMAVYGDSRSNPATHRKVAEQIARANVDLIVHTGDIVLNGKNHDSWRKEFFEPLGPLARSVPWVSTIGNHEADSENYFSYMALPGNERYFGLDFANAHIVCLDSNAWIAKGRDSKQYQWLADDLKRPRATTWTFVAFHHPLFSAHPKRPVNALRWDWAPLFLEPECQVDAVLTGHDHFYARNWRMGRVSAQPQPGVLFLTTAGGGASLYPSKAFDYVAREKSVHHFTLFEFDGDRANVSAIDLTGKVIDHFEMRKAPAPPEELCAYEVEEFRKVLRQAIAGAVPVRVQEGAPIVIDSRLRVPTTFAIPIAGELCWAEVPGWKIDRTTQPFHLQPRQVLEIPLHATVMPGAFARNPELTIQFEEGKFHNRTVKVMPFQLAGPGQVSARRTDAPLVVDGKADEMAWRIAPAHALLGLASHGGRASEVQFLGDRDWLYLAARLDRQPGATKENVRLVLGSGKKAVTFRLSPDQERAAFTDPGGDLGDDTWKAAGVVSRTTWTLEMAVPRKLIADWSDVRVNVIHRYDLGKETREMHLGPAASMGSDPETIADWKGQAMSPRCPRLLIE